MAIGLGGAGDDDVTEVHEINVTPFIDVMLVLLIIFMVAAPLSTVDVPVQLPGIEATPQPRPDKPVFVTLKADLTLAVGESPTSREHVADALSVALSGDKGKPVFLRADQSVAYRELMKVLDLLRKAGYLKVALVALEDTKEP
ncbi:MAG: TonB system transport protein ExbD [Hyphomicrobium sp.]